MITIHDVAPDFSLKDQDGITHQLTKSGGSWVVLYFYPKDDTPGCTIEACSFRDNWKAIKAKAVVYGISTDSTASHSKFATKYQLPFPLLADIDKTVVKAYQVAGLVTRRVSFIIDPSGKIAKIYPHVKPSEHVAEVLADLDLLQSNA